MDVLKVVFFEYLGESFKFDRWVLSADLLANLEVVFSEFQCLLRDFGNNQGKFGAKFFNFCSKLRKRFLESFEVYSHLDLHLFLPISSNR